MTHYAIKTVNNLYLNYKFHSTIDTDNERIYGDEGYYEIIEVDFKDCLILNKEWLDRFILEYYSGYIGYIPIDEQHNIKIKVIEQVIKVPTHYYNRILGGE